LRFGPIWFIDRHHESSIGLAFTTLTIFGRSPTRRTPSRQSRPKAPQARSRFVASEIPTAGTSHPRGYALARQVLPARLRGAGRGAAPAGAPGAEPRDHLTATARSSPRQPTIRGARCRIGRSPSRPRDAGWDVDDDTLSPRRGGRGSVRAVSTVTIPDQDSRRDAHIERCSAAGPGDAEWTTTSPACRVHDSFASTTRCCLGSDAYLNYHGGRRFPNRMASVEVASTRPDCGVKRLDVPQRQNSVALLTERLGGARAPATDQGTRRVGMLGGARGRRSPLSPGAKPSRSSRLRRRRPPAMNGGGVRDRLRIRTWPSPPSPGRLRPPVDPSP